MEVLDSLRAVQRIMEVQAMEALGSTEAQVITAARDSTETQAGMEALGSMAVQVTTEEALVFSRDFVLEINDTQ